MTVKNILFMGNYALGVIRFRGSLIETLSNQGHKVVVSFPDVTDELASSVVELGATPENVPMDRVGLNPLKDLSLIFTYIKLIRKHRIDVVSAYTIKPIVFGALASYLSPRLKFYATITGLGYFFTPQESTSLTRKFFIFLVKLLYKIALMRASKVIFQNPDDRDCLVDLKICSKEKCYLINGSGVDVDKFPVAPSSKEPVFIFVGRLLVDKGVAEFVEATKIVKAKHSNAKFIVVGDIDENPTSFSREQLEKWKSGCEIDFRGYVSDVAAALAEANIFVLPSYREGTPRSGLEAMALGRAIITTDVPGCREIVKDGRNGQLVEVKSVEGLASAMMKYIDDPDLIAKHGYESRLIAEEFYDVRKVNKVMIEYIGL